jgi:cell division protein ZapE
VSALREIYLRQITQRGFQSDDAQLAVVGQLDELRTQLIQAERKRSGTRAWLAKLAGGAGSPVRGLYLWGGVGRGKTWLMDMFFHSLPFERKRRRHFHRFMHEMHASLKALGQTESPLERVAQDIAVDARVLCFDELYVADIADAMILGGLFDALFRRGVTLMATSNAPPRDLYRNGLQRQRFLPAIDLLEKHARVVDVDGTTDYRLRQLTHAGTYLLTSAADTPRRLEALFAELADGSAASPGTVEIEGRRIPVVRVSDTAVWFEFEALCEGPRGAADYIEIARDYQSVLLSGVPALDETRDNAARRLISLVDELYDRNVNLVMAADAAPAGLYRGERLRREFERTASRLVEMQSEHYLAREHRP